MGALVQLAVELAKINCGQCGGVYAITEKYRASRQLKGESWNCPYCQVGWGYHGKGTLEAEQKRTAEEKARTQAALARANALAAELEAAKLAARKHATRAKNGTCPCCSRTFKQLAAHMKNKHPEYATS